MHSTPEHPRTSSWLPWRTSWHALLGLSCPAATTTGQQLCQHNGAEKTPSAWKRCALPLSRTTTTTNVSHRSLHGVARTKEQSQRRVCSLVPKMVFNDRPTLKDGHARISSWPGELVSTRRPYTFAQTCLPVQTSPCSPAADHTFSGAWPAHDKQKGCSPREPGLSALGGRFHIDEPRE